MQIPLLVSNGRDALGLIRKGDEVRAEGKIKFERWNDKEGFQRTGLAPIAANSDTPQS